MDLTLSAGEICTRHVVCTQEESSLREAAELMRRKHVGSVVVTRRTDHGEVPVGMLTDRDIAIVGVARDFDPQSIRVADIMATDLVTVSAGAPVSEVLQRMKDAGVRRVPVTTQDGLLMGIITLDDLLQVVVKEMQIFSQTVSSERNNEIKVRV